MFWRIVWAILALVVFMAVFPAFNDLMTAGNVSDNTSGSLIALTDNVTDEGSFERGLMHAWPIILFLLIGGGIIWRAFQQPNPNRDQRY